MRHISDHIAAPRDRKRDNATERGEMMKYFVEKLNVGRRRDGLPALTMPRMGRLLVAIPTNDLYYLKSICDKATDFSRKFWWEIKPENHTPEAKAAAEKKFAEDKRKKQTGDDY